jgi:general secretion pathway protein I
MLGKDARMRAGRRGFTLIEVMVAMAILALALTAILAAQAGALASASHARHISVATGLLRCKMTEIEAHLLKDGFQELDEADNGPCCEGDDSPNVRCSWRIEKPEFPEPKYGELNLDTDIGGGISGGQSAGGLGALGALAGAGDGANPFGKEASVGDVAQTLAGVTGGEGEAGAAGGLDGIIGTLMQTIYPDVKAIFEASTRRIVVKVNWTEGSREHEIEIAQWFTIPQKGVTPMPTGAESEDEATTGTGTSGRGTVPSPTGGR